LINTPVDALKIQALSLRSRILNASALKGPIFGISEKRSSLAKYCAKWLTLERTKKELTVHLRHDQTGNGPAGIARQGVN
jgi:hypothetical protein